MSLRSPAPLLLPLLLIAGTLALTSCEGTGEQDDLAQAQACLDNVSPSNPQAAQACLQFVSGYSSARANVLKCSIYMTSAGLTEDKIVQAYTSLRTSTATNKEANFMAALSLNLPTIDAAYDTVSTGNAYCKISGSSGMVFVGAAVLAGTYLNKVIASVTGSGVDASDPSAVQNKVQSMLADCTSATPSSACTTDLPTLGNTVLTLSSAYCSSSSANQDVCTPVNDAVQNAGSDPAKIGKALYCYLDKKTYNSSLDMCQ